MLKSSDHDIDPKLLAAEVNKMMPSVIKDLDNTEDKMAYGKEELLKYLAKNERVKALAFMYCFEGNTGESLNIKDIVDKKKSHNLKDIENEPTTFTEYNIDNLSCTNDSYTLSEVADTLLGFIKIYFPE